MMRAEMSDRLERAYDEALAVAAHLSGDDHMAALRVIGSIRALRRRLGVEREELRAADADERRPTRTRRQVHREYDTAHLKTLN